MSKDPLNYCDHDIALNKECMYCRNPGEAKVYSRRTECGSEVITKKVIDDSNCLSMEEHFKKVQTNNNYGKGRIAIENTNPKDLEGKKKSPLSLVPPSAIIHLAEGFKEGARKYGPYNWRQNKVQSLIYCDAILRHLLAFIDGEDIDLDSGKHHLDGVLCSAAVLVDALETGNLIDNRPPKGKASELLQRYTKEETK